MCERFKTIFRRFGFRETARLVLLIEYLEVFISMRFLMKDWGYIVYNFEYFTCHTHSMHAALHSLHTE